LVLAALGVLAVSRRLVTPAVVVALPELNQNLESLESKESKGR
tara:strand:+ start:956 stop:1084 length:129 start_codon:yes stop_codon:yes gene_type:complete